MKNQYAGDENDYLKYGLLRSLCTGLNGSVLVAWMLTPNDGGSDGLRRSYLEQPDRFRHLDTDLFDHLRGLFLSGEEPSVSLIECHGIVPKTTFFSRLVPDDGSSRRQWSDQLLQASRGSELVFLDPDNGIEVASKPIGRKGSSKFILWSELTDLWHLGKSLLIYQHFPREERDGFISRIRDNLEARLGAGVVHFFSCSHVLFLLVCQEEHAALLGEAARRISEQWKSEVEVGLGSWG